MIPYILCRHLSPYILMAGFWMSCSMQNIITNTNNKQRIISCEQRQPHCEQSLTGACFLKWPSWIPVTPSNIILPFLFFLLCCAFLFNNYYWLQITTAHACIHILFLFFKFSYPHFRTCLLILDRREGRETERERTSIWERYITWLPLTHAPTRDQTCNSGTCPDWELNLWPFSLRDDAPTNWATPARATQLFQMTSFRMVLDP